MSQVIAFRPEIVHTEPQIDVPQVEKSLAWFERVYRIGFIRKAAILAGLAVAWELYGRWLGNPLLFPTFSDTFAAFIQNIADGTIPIRAWASLKTLIVGYGIGVALAGLLTTLAIGSRIGADLLETLTSMFNPLPAIALLPLALIWFGLGQGSIIFVLVHSVLWAIALNTHAGFRSVSNTLRMVGLNYGLRGIKLVRLLDECQIMQWIEHKIFALVGAGMAGNHLRAAGDNDLT